MTTPSAWTYVDAHRTHEVRVTIERGKTLDFVVREMAFGGAPAEEVYTERFTLRESWERTMRVLALETRLAMLGSYFKGAPGPWTPLRLARTGPHVDLSAMDVGSASEAIEFHHFVGEGSQTVSLVGLKKDTDTGRRWLLVRLDAKGPDPRKGVLHVVHPQLTPKLYRSALTSVQLELSAQRFRKLPRDAGAQIDPRQFARLRAVPDAVLAQLVTEASAKLDQITDGRGHALTARQLAIVQDAARSSKGAASRERTYDLDDEFDLAATGVGGKRPDIMIEELSPDVFGALQEPRLLAIHERFMPGPAEASLFARGERAIGLAMRELRDRVRPDERHLVSLLEASLLLRYALKNRIPVEPDVIKRVKNARAYL